MYDVTNFDSFEKLLSWKENFIAHSHPEHVESFPFIMIGNKIDLEDERCISTEKAEDAMVSLGMTDYFETSAKLNADGGS